VLGWCGRCRVDWVGRSSLPGFQTLVLGGLTLKLAPIKSVSIEKSLREAGVRRRLRQPLWLLAVAESLAETLVFQRVYFGK
jgi:hypothetical protein